MPSIEPLPVKQEGGAKKPPALYKQMGDEKSVEEVSENDRLQQLEQMLLESQRRAEKMEKEAYDRAYMAGEKAGLALGKKRAELILAQMQKELDDLKDQVRVIRNAMVEAIVDISGTIAEWIVGEMTASDRERLLALAERAANAFPETDNLVLAVHPEDQEQFETVLRDSINSVPIVADARMERGCIRVFNKEKDVLIDPYAAVRKAVHFVKSELLSDCDDVHGDR